MKTTLIKLIIFICLVTSSPVAKAGWFDNNIDEQRERLSRVEQELAIQRRNADVWASIAGTLCVGCVLLLIIGTALGAKVRRHHATKH